MTESKKENPAPGSRRESRTTGPKAAPTVVPAAPKVGRKYFTPVRDAIPLPNLVESQVQSYQWFLKDGLQELFDEFNPIEAYGGAMTLEFLDY